MFSKVISFFDRFKKSKKFELFNKNKNYEKKSMEWQDDEDDCRIDSFSWIRRNALEKSKSDSSITAIGDCNFQTHGLQVSLENCNMPTKIVTTLQNLDLNDDNDDNEDTDENDPNFVPTMKDYEIYNNFDHNLLHYGLETQDITTKQLVIQELDILNFQGNKHTPEELARYWKKDCRMWLWKSVRFAKRQKQLQTTVIAS